MLHHGATLLVSLPNDIIILFLPPPDSTVTVENLLGVMEKVTDGRAEEVWGRLIGSTRLKDISSKCSTERELISTCADIYVNYKPDSSWEWLARALYSGAETAAVEEVRSYLNPRGRFSRWVWLWWRSICTAR